MRPDLIREGHVAGHPVMGVSDSLIGMEIDVLIFETPPQPLDKDIVPPPPGSIHADLNSMSLQKPSEFLAGELTAVIRVEDLWGTIAGDGLPHHFHTEIRGQRIGEPPRYHPATRPVEDRTEIDEAPFHRNVRNIRRPHMIRLGDRHLAQ